jgi:hypothetical protein
MPDEPLHSPTQAAKAASISLQSLRNYAKRYVRYLSPHATPKAGETSWFTRQDIKLLAYIAYKTTKQNLSHEQLLAQLEQGTEELEEFTDYTAPGEQPESTELIFFSKYMFWQAVLRTFSRRTRNADSQKRPLDGTAKISSFHCIILPLGSAHF